MRRRVLLLLAAAACGHGDRAPAASAPSNVEPAPKLAAARMPAGWIAIDPPDDDRLRCANYSDDEWQVAVDGDALRIVKAAPREPDTGPPLAFEAPGRTPRGRRHVARVRDGFLVGYDAGEWGGALYWVSADGSRHTQLAQQNVRGVVPLGEDHAIALEGLAHLSLNEGAARWLERTSQGWSTTRVDPIDGEPQAFVAAPDAIYAITLDHLIRIRRDGRIETIQPLATPGLYPDSMAVDATGQLWIGMRQLVLRLTPAGGHYTPQWFAEARCRTATTVDLSCRCGG